MALVTLSKFNDDNDAAFARLALEAEGINAVVVESRLQVDEADVEAADAVLNRLTGVAGAEYATPSDAHPWVPPQTCPACGAPEVVRRQKWVLFGVTAICVAAIAYTQDATLLGFFIIAALAVFILVSPAWRCRDCGETW